MNDDIVGGFKPIKGKCTNPDCPNCSPTQPTREERCCAECGWSVEGCVKPSCLCHNPPPQDTTNPNVEIENIVLTFLKNTPRLKQESGVRYAERLTQLVIDIRSQLLSSLIKEAAAKRYLFEERDWGDGLTSIEPVGDDTVSRAEAEGYNRALDDVLTLLKQWCYPH